jgi:hypothetical protein
VYFSELLKRIFSPLRSFALLKLGFFSSISILLFSGILIIENNQINSSIQIYFDDIKSIDIIILSVLQTIFIIINFFFYKTKMAETRELRRIYLEMLSSSSLSTEERTELFKKLLTD